MGQTHVTVEIFAPDKAEPLLGVVALENTGFAVDPRTKALKRSTRTRSRGSASVDGHRPFVGLLEHHH